MADPYILLNLVKLSGRSHDMNEAGKRRPNVTRRNQPEKIRQSAWPKNMFTQG